MSLRTFHIFFIVTSTLFCLGFGAWAVAKFHAGYAPGNWLAVIGFAAGAGLVPYLAWFVRSHPAA